MNHTRFYLAALILLTTFTGMFAQEKKFSIDYYKDTGTLNEQDSYKQEFGRYDGYQIPLRKGERFNVIVYSEEFYPSVALVTPGNKVYRQVNNTSENLASFQVEIPEEGEWYLYVIGEKYVNGNYMLHYGFASPGSVEYDNDFDFCTSLHYFLAHSKASFVFLERSEDGIPVLKGGENAYINGDDASYNALMYSGSSREEAVQKYEDIVSGMNECLGEGWSTDSIEWTQVEDHKKKYFVLNKKRGNDWTYAKVSISDFSGLQGEYHDDYVVEMTINNYIPAGEE